MYEAMRIALPRNVAKSRISDSSPIKPHVLNAEKKKKKRVKTGKKKKVGLRHTLPRRGTAPGRFSPPTITMLSVTGQLPPVGLDCLSPKNVEKEVEVPLLDLSCERTLADGSIEGLNQASCLGGGRLDLRWTVAFG